MSFLNNLVLAKDVNGLISYTRIGDLDPQTDQIYDVKNGQFIDFVLRSNDKPVKSLVRIKAGSLGYNKPFSDIWLHVGLGVEYRRTKTSASKLFQRFWVSVRSNENMYALCTSKGQVVDIAGLPVWTWRDASWLRIENSQATD